MFKNIKFWSNSWYDQGLNSNQHSFFVQKKANKNLVLQYFLSKCNLFTVYYNKCLTNSFWKIRIIP